MWVAADLEGKVLYRHVDWHNVVKWAMRHGGEVDIVWQHGWGDNGAEEAA